MNKCQTKFHGAAKFKKIVRYGLCKTVLTILFFKSD